ncbi:hypothetical protein NQ315_012786, partial [Exocentrus adspersus]
VAGGEFGKVNKSLGECEEVSLPSVTGALSFEALVNENREPQPSTSNDNFVENNTEADVQISRNTNISWNVHREPQPSTSSEDYEETANVFAEFFSSIYDANEATYKMNYDTEISSVNDGFYITSITESDFDIALKKLKPKKAAEVDLEPPIAGPLVYESNTKKKDDNLDHEVPIESPLVYELNTKQNVETRTKTCEIETAFEVQENDIDQPELRQREILLGEAKKYNGRRIRDKRHSCFFLPKNCL